MIRRVWLIPAEFTGGKWQGVSPRELEFADLCYLSRRSPSPVDRAVASQEIFRRLRAAKHRRYRNGR